MNHEGSPLTMLVRPSTHMVEEENGKFRTLKLLLKV